jgi:hypothetical protein
MRRRKYSEDTTIAMHQMASNMAEGSIVTQALSRYLFQILEFVFEEYIGPQRDRIKELEHRLTVLGGKID